ncbi:hypothetical protein GCM10023088_51870 [Actinomadura verrucosospora]
MTCAAQGEFYGWLSLEDLPRSLVVEGKEREHGPSAPHHDVEFVVCPDTVWGEQRGHELRVVHNCRIPQQVADPDERIDDRTEACKSAYRLVKPSCPIFVRRYLVDVVSQWSDRSKGDIT